MHCLKCRQEILQGTPKYGLHPNCFTTWFKAEASLEFVSITQRSAQSKDPDKNQSANNTSFYHGKFKKYSADLAADGYIIKMRDEKEAPELPEVEYLCNQIADYVGLPIPQYHYIDFYSQKVFVSKVFIKKAGATANLEHIYKYRADDQHNCESLTKVIADATKRPYDVEIFHTTLLFDALIGNHDRHGRNLAFIVTPSGTTLSPIYDNVSYLSLVSGNLLQADFNPTGKILTKTSDEPSMIHYVAELKRLGQEELIQKFVARAKIQKLEELVDHSFCTTQMKEALKKLIKKRHKELIDGVQN